MRMTGSRSSCVAGSARKVKTSLWSKPACCSMLDHSQHAQGGAPSAIVARLRVQDERLVLRLVDVLADERPDVTRRINVRGKGIFFQKLAHQFDPATSSTWPSASTARHR